MAGEVEQLRNFIQASLSRDGSVSLVEVVAYFDYQNHSVPSAWRLNQALAELTIPAVVSLDGLHLESSSEALSTHLSDGDMARIVEDYMSALRARPDRILQQTR